MRKEEIWRDVDRGKLREGQKKRKNSARGDTLHHRRYVGLRHRALFDLPRARRRRSCWRDLSGKFEVMRALLMEMSSIVVSHRMVGTPGILTKDFGEGSQMKCGVMDWVYFCYPNHL